MYCQPTLPLNNTSDLWSQTYYEHKKFFLLTQDKAHLLIIVNYSR